MLESNATRIPGHATISTVNGTHDAAGEDRTDPETYVPPASPAAAATYTSRSSDAAGDGRGV